MDNKDRITQIESIYATAQAEARDITDAELAEIERLTDATIEASR